MANDIKQGGAESVFDQALANGVAAIISRRWPGEEMDGNCVKAGRAMLCVVSRKADEPGSDVREIEPGVYELPDLRPPSESECFAAEPRPTVVRVSTLLDGIKITQPARHAREHERRYLSEEHVKALKDLNGDAALAVDLSGFDLDEHEERLALADSIEVGRANRYMQMLDDDERDRREAADYDAVYSERVDDEMIRPAECPVCGLKALVPSGFDSYVDEIPWGTCVACSYTRTSGIADLAGLDVQIGRAVDNRGS